MSPRCALCLLALVCLQLSHARGALGNPFLPAVPTRRPSHVARAVRQPVPDFDDDGGSCRVCEVALNDTARSIVEGASAATRDAIQAGLKIPEGGRLRNPGFLVSLDPVIGCTNPPDECRELFLNMAHIWNNAFRFIDSGPGDSAQAWTQLLMQKTSLWMTDVILNFNHYNASGGFGAGYGFSIECGGKPVVTWGVGFGGGINAIPGQTSAGYGGGGGGQHVQDFGGGCGCAADQMGVAYNCGAAPDTTSEALLQTWLQQGAATLASNPDCQATGMTLCGSGGGGGGYQAVDGCAGGFGGGFGFVFTPVSLSQQPQPPAQCSSAGSSPTNTVGPLARTCSTQCATKPNFNACFCPCFKASLTTAGIPWGPSITCATN